MRAKTGDQVVVRGHKPGQPDRRGVVLEARGPEGTPPFMVRWDDTGHETLFFPSADCHVETPAASAKS